MLTATACWFITSVSSSTAVHVPASLRITPAVCTSLQPNSRARVATDASTSEHHGQPDVIYLSHDGSVRTVVVAAACPAAMQRNTPWCGSCGAAASQQLATGVQKADKTVCRVISDFDLHKQLYKGKASVLYSATCKLSGLHLALKLYRKPRLSDLNWFQVTAGLTAAAQGVCCQLRHGNKATC